MKIVARARSRPAGGHPAGSECSEDPSRKRAAFLRYAAGAEGRGRPPGGMSLGLALERDQREPKPEGLRGSRMRVRSRSLMNSPGSARNENGPRGATNHDTAQTDAKQLFWHSFTICWWNFGISLARGSREASVVARPPSPIQRGARARGASRVRRPAPTQPPTRAALDPPRALAPWERWATGREAGSRKRSRGVIARSSARVG